MIRVTKRVARKRHACTACTHAILPGDSYLEHVASPYHDDLGNDHWWRLCECRDCGERYGREAS